MCDPVATGAAITLLAACFITLLAQMAVFSQGKPERTQTHTVEQYHGNWWSTWHTPRQDRWMTRLGIVNLGTITLLVITAIAAASRCG